MKNNLDIDQLIKEGMANFEPTPPADAWSFIEKQIQVTPAPSGQGNQLMNTIQQMSLGGKILAVAGVSIVSLGLYFGLNQNKVEKIDLPQQENTIQPEAVEQETILVPETVDAVEIKTNTKKQVSESKVEIEATSNQINSAALTPPQNLNSVKVLDQTESPVKAAAKDIESKKNEKEEEGKLINRNSQGEENNNIKNNSNSNVFDPIISNAFSPDGDGLNDTWKVQIDHASYYHVTIVDGNGEVVFESNQLNNAWNGANWKTGVDCASGRYVYVIDYQLNDETERQTKRGFINLFR